MEGREKKKREKEERERGGGGVRPLISVAWNQNFSNRWTWFYSRALLTSPSNRHSSLGPSLTTLPPSTLLNTNHASY
ncbi:hypothetical protein TIFTF001_026535 [Ficus carica]|uniref:Uncharacterized protein n=1 Tax=Ficus carica TaxID=3494 RepID=A0AA88IX09_FICCA|nr:hypothetical protein TIFTF001_026535 [Ficus carica]